MPTKYEQERIDDMPPDRREAMQRAIDEDRLSDAYLDADEGRDDDVGTDITVFDEELDDIEIAKRDQRLLDEDYDLKSQASRHQAAKRAIARAVARKFPNNPLGKRFDPLVFLGLVAASPRVSLDLRVNAAKTVVQYTQPKPPTELHQRIEEDIPIVDKEAIRAKLDQLLAKAGANVEEADREDEDREG